MRKLWSSGSARFRVSFFCAPFCASVLPGPNFRRLRIFLFSAPPLPGCLLPCCFSSELLFLLSELFFFLLGCCLPSEVSGALLPFSCAFFPRLLSRAPSSCTPSSCTPSFLTPSSPRTLFPAYPLSRTPFFRASFPVRSLSRALSFPRASFCTPSFRASRTFLPRLHSSRLEPSPQLEHSPTGTSAERNGSGWNGSKWGSNVCAIVFGASTGPSRAVYVTKLLNIFRILLKYLHNSKRPRIFAVKF